MHHVFVFFCFFITFSVSATALPDSKSHHRMLFVGNSLTYVGNLPAVFDALAAKNNVLTESDMIVRGGATLTERVADHSVELALKSKVYDFVVLQERGGDIICGFGPETCENADSAMAELSKIALQNNAKPILLGTYQKPAHVSEELVAEEAKLAKRYSAIYVSVSGKLQKAMQHAPNANWFYTDNGHPGHDLVLLEAMLLYKQLFAVQDFTGELIVNAPLYKPNTQFSVPSPLSLPIASDDSPFGYTYTKKQLSKVHSLISK